MKDLYICRACWLVATPKVVTQGSFLIEIMLWCSFILPGVLYSMWRSITKEKVCPVCSSLAVSPIDSLMGRKLFYEIHANSKRNTRFVDKLLNYQQDDFIKVDHKRYEGQYQERGT
jgi:hypothetical protein